MARSAYAETTTTGALRAMAPARNWSDRAFLAYCARHGRDSSRPLFPIEQVRRLAALAHLEAIDTTPDRSGFVVVAPEAIGVAVLRARALRTAERR